MDALSDPRYKDGWGFSGAPGPIGRAGLLENVLGTFPLLALDMERLLGCGDGY